MKYFSSYWRNVYRCERAIGVIIAETAEEARKIASRHIRVDEEDIEISEIMFSEDGFCEVYCG